MSALATARNPTETHALQEAYEICAAITKREARNFWYGIKLLPRDERAAITVVYAWMRVADDLVDGTVFDAAAQGIALDALELETRAAFAQQPSVSSEGERAAILRALSDVARRFSVRIEDFLGAIDGQRADLVAYVLVDETAVDEYCDRVASTVGRICVGIWGVIETASLDEAMRLATLRGIAFQRTNMIRDLQEDAAKGRCYFSTQTLQSFGLTRENFLLPSNRAACEQCIAREIVMARDCFAKSAKLESLVAPACRPTLYAMTRIYRELLERIAEHPARVLSSQRVALPIWRKAWIAASITVRAKLGMLR